MPTHPERPGGLLVLAQRVGDGDSAPGIGLPAIAPVEAGLLADPIFAPAHPEREPRALAVGTAIHDREARRQPGERAEADRPAYLGENALHGWRPRRWRGNRRRGRRGDDRDHRRENQAGGTSQTGDVHGLRGYAPAGPEFQSREAEGRSRREAFNQAKLTKLSSTRFRPACSKSISSLLPSI